MRGRRKAYETAEALEAAVQAYFDSISRMETVKVPKETGKLDEYGHPIEKMAAVRGANGKAVKARVFYVPPERYGLTAHLGISIDTWMRYAGDEELGEVVRWAEEQMLGWKARELLQRENKRTSGLIYELERNHKAEKAYGDDPLSGRSPLAELTDAQLAALAGRLDQ